MTVFKMESGEEMYPDARPKRQTRRPDRLQDFDVGYAGYRQTDLTQSGSPPSTVEGRVFLPRESPVQMTPFQTSPTRSGSFHGNAAHHEVPQPHQGSLYLDSCFQKEIRAIQKKNTRLLQSRQVFQSGLKELNEAQSEIKEPPQASAVASRSYPVIREPKGKEEEDWPEPGADLHRGMCKPKSEEQEFDIGQTYYAPEDAAYPSVFPADVQQLLVIKEEDPPEWSPSLDQKDPEPPDIKEEQEELWTSQEGEQLNGLQEADISRFPFTAVHVKSEDDEEKPQSSHLHRSQPEDNREAELPASSSGTQIKTETDGEDCGGSEPARNLDPDSPLQPNTDGKASDSSETEVSDDDWQEPLSDSGPETEDSDNSWKETESDVNALKYKEAPVSDVECNVGKKPFRCFECGKQFNYKGSLQKHMTRHLGNSSSFLVNQKCVRIKQKVDSEMQVQAGEKPFGCDVCGKRFYQQTNLTTHMRVHTGEKPFGCDVCGKRFNQPTHLKTHVRVHTGEKPFGCNVCGKTFYQERDHKRHMRVHTGEKPFGCDVCGKRFNQRTHLKRHIGVHTGEKPFGCDVCGQRFDQKTNLKIHMRVHTGEKPFGCDVCGKRFNQQRYLKKHLRVHTGEKPFGCDVCGRKFNQKAHLKKHMLVHTR